MHSTLNEQLSDYALPPAEQHTADNHELRRALNAEPGAMYRAAVALANAGDGGAAGQRLQLRADGRYRDAIALGQRRERSVTLRAAPSLLDRTPRGRLRD